MFTDDHSHDRIAMCSKQGILEWFAQIVSHHLLGCYGGYSLVIHFTGDIKVFLICLVCFLLDLFSYFQLYCTCIILENNILIAKDLCRAVCWVVLHLPIKIQLGPYNKIHCVIYINQFSLC